MSFMSRWFGGNAKPAEPIIEPEPSTALAVLPNAQLAPQGPRKPGDGVVIGPISLSDQIQRIGGNLRPIDVSNIIQEADTGDIRRLMDLGNEARQKDCHLQGVLYTRDTTLASLPWQIEVYAKEGQKPKTKDLAIRDFVEEVLRSIYGYPAVNMGAPDDICGLRHLFAHMAGGAFYGFAPAETLWGKIDGFLVPVGFSLLKQRRFIYRQVDGRLCWMDNGMAEPIDLMKSYAPGKFIIHRPRINGDVACREGLIRPLMWAALFRNWAMRDWLNLAELAWKPYRTGYWKRDASKDDIDALIQALRALSTSGVAAFPETTQFQVEWPKHSVSSGQSMHGELAAFFAGEMSKCVLGQTLTTEAGQKGARALGQVHELVRQDIAESDAIQAAATIQAQLIAPLVRLNFGPDAKMPRFFFVTNETADIQTFADGILKLRKAGTEIPAKWVRDRVGMPEPDDEDELLGPIDPKADSESDSSTPPTSSESKALDAPQDEPKLPSGE